MKRRSTQLVVGVSVCAILTSIPTHAQDAAGLPYRRSASPNGQGPAVFAQKTQNDAQELISADAMERKARVVTDLDAAMESIELHGRIWPPSGAGRPVRFYFRHRSSGRLASWISLEDSPAAYAISADDQYLMYDAHTGDMLLISGQTATFSFTIQDGGIHYGLGTAPASSPPRNRNRKCILTCRRCFSEQEVVTVESSATTMERIGSSTRVSRPRRG